MSGTSQGHQGPTLTVVPHLWRENENWTLVPSVSLGLQFLSNRWVLARSPTVLLTVDKSITTVSQLLLEQTTKIKATSVTCHWTPALLLWACSYGCIQNDWIDTSWWSRGPPRIQDAVQKSQTFQRIPSVWHSGTHDSSSVTLEVWLNISAITFSRCTCSRSWRAARPAAASGCCCSWCNRAGPPVLLSGQ